MLSNETPPCIPKRGQKKASVFSIEAVSILDVNLDNLSPAMTCNLTTGEKENHDLRDSGISITDHTNVNNFNICYEEFELRQHQQEMNISLSPSDVSPGLEHPPPIPPKISSLNSSFEQGASSTLERHANDSIQEATSVDNYSVPKSSTSEIKQLNSESPS